MTGITHYRPKHTFQLHQQIRVLGLKGMLPQKQSKFREMSLLSQRLAPFFGFGDLAVEVRRRHSIEEDVVQILFNKRAEDAG